MTISECVDQGIARVRLPQWHPHAYLKLELTADGHYGAWAELFDRPGIEASGGTVPMHILVFDVHDTNLEPYTGELDPDDSVNHHTNEE